MSGLLFGLLAVLLAYLGIINNKYKSLIRLLLVFLLAYVVGMGGLSFTDHDNYAMYYNSVSSNFRDINWAFIGISQVVTGFETGYVLLNYICHFFGLTEAAFFFVTAFITNYFIVRTIYRFKYPVFSIILLIVSISFLQQANIVRQMLSVSIFVYGMAFFNKDKIKYYVLCVIIATLIHTSAVIMLALIPLAFLQDKKKAIMYSIGSIWLLSLFVFIGLIHPDFLHFLDFFTYYESKVHNTDQLTDNVLIITYNVYAILGFWYLLRNKSEEVSGYFLLFFMGSILLNMSSQFYFFYRLSFFAIPVSVFLLPTILNSLPPIIGRYSVLFIFALLFYISVFYRDVLFNPDFLYFKEMYSFIDLF